MTPLDIPPSPALAEAITDYTALCARQARAPATIPGTRPSHPHALHQAVVLATHRVDLALEGVAAAERRLALARRHMMRAQAALEQPKPRPPE